MCCLCSLQQQRELSGAWNVTAASDESRTMLLLIISHLVFAQDEHFIDRNYKTV